MTLHEVRQFFFKTRYEVFGDSFLGVGYDTGALIAIFQSLAGDSRLSDVKTPKVLVCAVDKSSANLKFRFFNNCFDDDYSTQKVWEVARYTSAAPGLFKEKDDFIDGGILAQNPSTLGLARIHDHYQTKGQKLPLSLVVSIGTGIPPDRELGSVDAQDYLSFGPHWFDEDHLEKFKNFLTLFVKAVVYAQSAHYNCKISCAGADIPYFRFDPPLPGVIPPGETDFGKLLSMIIKAKRETGEKMDRLVEKLHQSVVARTEYLKTLTSATN